MAHNASWIIRSSRMMTLGYYPPVTARCGL
jgi:hypothetical protein